MPEDQTLVPTPIAMKIGYHFTTWETWQEIKEDGLRLSPLAERHAPGLYQVRKFIEDDCIWVYTKRMSLDKLPGMIFYVGINHTSHRIVRLAVDYDDWQAASYRAKQELSDPASYVRLNHTLIHAGPFNHSAEPFELLVEPISPIHIRLAGRWDLRQLVRDGLPGRERHCVP